MIAGGVLLAGALGIAIPGFGPGFGPAFGPALAHAQGEPPQQPLDVNAVQPSATPPAQPPADPAPVVELPGDGAAATPATPADGASADAGATPPDAAVAAVAASTGRGERDKDIFPVSGFRIAWKFPERAGQGDLQAAVDAAVATLGIAADGAYVSPKVGLSTVEIPVRDIGAAAPAQFYISGIDAVAQAVVDELNRRNLVGVVIEYDGQDVSPDGMTEDGEAISQDRRAGARTDIGLFVWTRRVSMVRSIALGERLEDVEQKIDSDDPVHARIRAQSPLQADSLLTRKELDEFVFRLNRHPGRRVDVALAGGDEPGDVVIDYLVNESKPWAIYAQLSNTGTRSTGEWRQRFGFTHNQLTKHDDILRVDYVTAGFDDANAISASYDFPLLSDKVRTRVYGAYSEFTASDLGQSDLDFGGETIQLGAEVVGTIWQRGEWFLDLSGGARWQRITVTNEATQVEGEANFLIPYVGLNASRFTDDTSTLIGATLEFNATPHIAGTDESEIQELGRQNVDEEWALLKFQAEHSFYLDKMLGAQGMEGPEGASGATRRWPTLAHEISLALRGQHALGHRLIPQEEDVAGGFFSVRGYPESAAAGDTLLIASAEYRFHLPRIFPVSEPGFIGAREMGFKEHDFRWAPQQEFGRADWDLILRAFVDLGQTVNSDPEVGESDETLVGAGIGAELQVKRNLTLRLDWGFALQEVGSEQQDDLVEAGNNEVHFSATLLY